MKRILAAMVVVAGLSACGGSTFNGTVLGNSLNPADAVFAVLRDATGKSQGMIFMLSDKPNICTTLKANRVSKSSTSMWMMLQGVNAAGEVLSPEKGDHTVISTQPTSPGKYAAGAFGKTDANCTGILTDAQTQARAGIVKVLDFKAEAGGSLSATFDITFGGQADKVTGTLSAAYCDLTALPSASPVCE